MEIRWLQAVLDLPAANFDAAGDFWTTMTNSTRGDINPDHDEFVHLHPATGDMHLELQRIDDAPARAHLDVVVDDIAAWTERAVELGATLIARPGHSVLETPGGVPFCIVPATELGANAAKAPPIDSARPHAADQICLDVPHEHFDADVEFWSALTGWEVNPAKFPEFRSFAQPEALPLRMLIQQLGVDDNGGGRSHLDISSGDHVHELAADHEAAGAKVLDQQKYWTALTDPSGMPYCLTSRPPSTDV